MLIAGVLLTATVAASPPQVVAPVDVQALGERLTKRWATAPAVTKAPACEAAAPKPAANTAPESGPKRLGQLPPHRQYMTVLRKERGCDVAVIKEGGRNTIVPLPGQKGVQLLARNEE
jgi:hypothetical protein